MMRKLTATGLTALALAGLVGTGAALAGSSHSARPAAPRGPYGLRTGQRLERQVEPSAPSRRQDRRGDQGASSSGRSSAGAVDVAVSARTVTVGQSGSLLSGTGSRPTVTHQQVRRGVYHDVPELIAAIEFYIEGYNQRAQPFTWTKTTDQILAKATKQQPTSETLH